MSRDNPEPEAEQGIPRLPELRSTPVATFARLVHALHEADRQLEGQPLPELRQLGFTIAVDRMWRRGAQS
jgi:hypothetical protein